jgi:6,7-dimethyl-8-ribityllumazine synthase
MIRNPFPHVKTSVAPSIPDGRGLRVAVVRSRFNHEVTERLLAGARAALEQAGVAEARIRLVEVPGAVELPLAAQILIERGRIDAVICLGAVIRGETDHYEHVCRVAADGIQRISLKTGVPVGFGVLTCESLEQALARAGDGADNRGFHAALAALEMALLKRRLARKRR